MLYSSPPSGVQLPLSQAKTINQSLLSLVLYLYLSQALNLPFLPHFFASNILYTFHVSCPCP